VPKTKTAAYPRLVSAATKLFALNGPDKTTTREIAEEAGSSLSSIHVIFGSKDGLYREAMRLALEAYKVGNAAAIEHAEGFLASGSRDVEQAWRRLEELIASVSSWALDGRNYYEIRLVNRELMFPGKAFDMFEGGITDLQSLLCRLIAVVNVDGSDFDNRFLSYTIVTSIFDHVIFSKAEGSWLGMDFSDGEARATVKERLDSYLVGALRGNVAGCSAVR